MQINNNNILQRFHDPKEVVGKIFMDIVNDIAPELRKLFGVDRAPKATMLKMPKFGGHVSRMADFLEQMTSMLGFTENIVGAWQLARKTGRLHVKVGFLEENQNQLEKNYFTIVTDYFIGQFIGYVTGEKVCILLYL
uniref:Globin family profile domain-containing protein n=1 Tax=Panagrolaimus superbus TaxID=310955 RepID=A0A914Y4B8_9BILA